MTTTYNPTLLRQHRPRSRFYTKTPCIPATAMSFRTSSSSGGYGVRGDSLSPLALSAAATLAAAIVVQVATPSDPWGKSRRFLRQLKRQVSVLFFGPMDIQLEFFERRRERERETDWICGCSTCSGRTGRRVILESRHCHWSSSSPIRRYDGRCVLFLRDSIFIMVWRSL
mmetsp:Transcript_19528/g.36518  ORF Transcript_19528/g.36518 Transcript_19528/m.36518 type:complete len:170 (+) Transcript_19528:58-567(+)